MKEVFLDGRQAGLAEILQTLELYGVAVVSNYVAAADLPPARDEFFRLMATQEAADLFLKKNKSRIARLWNRLPGEYKTLDATLYSERTRQIADSFYGPHKYLLNEHVYLTHDVDKMDFNAGWHPDQSRSLKFMLYLNDVSEENGAMKYIPGSNYHGIYRIHYYRFRGDDDFPTYLPENEVPAGGISLNGKAGTMVIFDAAGFHMAGSLKPDAERLIIRGHCLIESTFRTRLADRIRKSVINVLKHIQTEDECVDDRFKSKASHDIGGRKMV
ncbi:MAG: hypothetical protein RL274_523 [Pseudomonadota bacterium]|jgi:hypothetical protein